PKIEALRAAWEAFGTNDRLAVLTLVVQPTGPYDFHAWREDFPWPQTQLRDLPRYVAYSLRSSLGLPMDQMMASPLPDLPGAMLLGPDGKIVATDLHGDAIKAAVAKALSAKPDSIAPSGTNQTNAASDPANSSRPAQEVAWGEVTQGLQVGLSCTDLETTSDRQPRFDVHLRNRLDRPLAIPSEDAFISLLRADWPEFRSRPLAPQITPLGEGRTTYFITGGVEMRDARATRRVLGPGETVVVSNLQLSAGTFVPGQDSYGTKTSEQTYLLLPGGEYRVAYVFESAQTNIEGEPVWNGKAASGELTVTVRPPVPAEGLEGSFQLAKSNFFVGELIYATLNLRSTSAKPVSFANGGDYFNGRDARYSFTAADEAGRPVPDPLLNHPGVGGGPGGARTLKRGETFSDQVLVNLYLNFTNAGHYTLICHRTLSLVEPGQLEGIAPQFPVESKFSVNLVRDDQAHAREVEQVFAGYDASQDEMIGAWATARDEAAFPEIEKRAKAPGRYQSNFISWVAEYGEQGVPALLVAARSSEPSCRSLALSLLSGMKAKEAPELVKASLGSTDARERAEAVLQCSKQRVPGTLESLLAMGKDPDPLVRRYLGAALGAWGDERAVPVLLDLLHDANPDPFIRIWAAGGLSALGHKREPVPVMIDLLRTMKPSDGAGNVMLCLKDLTGQDLGQNPARWIEWWEKEGTTYKGGANPSGITLEIRCETNVFKVGDEIPIQFIISNHGTADYKYLNITPDHGGGLLEFRLVANTASGENVPDPRMHSDQVFAGGVSSPAVLHPGESFTKIIPLNRWALIKEAGRYDVVGNYLQQPLGNPIVLASSAPIRITVSPRTKEEMDDYVKGLTNQIAARLPFQAGGNGGQYDFVLEDSMRKLAYSCSPGGVPTLLTVINEYSEYCPQAVWGQEALLYYVPHTEETRKSILQSAARNGLNDLMEHILQHYELNHAEWKPIIDAALGPRNPGEWYFGATLAADSCYDDAFTSRLIAIALDSNAPARVGNVVLEGPPRNNTRAAAIEALARNRTDEGVRALKTLLNDPNREIWEPLAEAIQDGYSTRANTPPPNDPAPEVFVPLGVGFPDAHRGRINSPTGRRLQPGDIEAKDVIPLIERLLAYQGPYLPLDGVNFAAWFGDDALTPTLVSLATTPGSGYRGNAIWGLALNRTDEGVKTLKTLLNDPDPKTSKLVEQIIRNAYLSRGDARGRPLRPDDFDAKYQQPEANPSGIMLEIRCTNEVLKVGDEIPIEFIISNHGTKDYRYGDTVFGPNISRQPFELHAKTDSGQKLLNAATLNYPAIAAQGHSIIPAIPVEFAESGVLHPGGSFTKINPLNVWALVKDPGHYEVEGAFFNFYDFPNWAPVAAAPIRITVLPRTEEDMHNYIADLTNRVAERLAGRKGKPATSTDWAMVGLLSKLAYTCSPEIVPCLFQTISDDSADHTEGYWMHEALGYYVPHTEEIRKAVVEAGSKDYLYEHMKDFLGWVLADYGVQSEEVKPLEKPAQPASTNANTGETPAAAPNRARDFADLVTVQQAVGMPSGLSLEIRCTNTVLKVGDEIPIEFIVSNHRTNDYEYEDRVSNRSGRLDEFRLDATTASGERVPDPRATLTAWMGGGTYGPGVLYPGQSFTKIIALNRWALIKEPGRYEVTGTYLGAEISTNPIAPVTAKPISVTVLPRSKKEMGDYIRGLTNELSLLLATHVPDRYDGPLEETLKKLMYTCSPEIVPTLLATQYDSVEGFWANEALLYYVPRTEETWQAILQAAPSHLSSGNMQYTLWNYGGNGELLRPLIAWALAAENPAVWQAGAQLAAGNYYDDAFTARLIAIASDASASKYSRDEAFEALARNRTDAGVKTLKTLLDDPNPDIWVPLSQAILNGLSSECKSPTGKHLQPADFGTKDMKPLIQRLLATSEPMVRSLGMSLAQHFGDDAFTPKLVEAAMSYGPERTGATYALAMNRTDDGVRTLKTLLHDYDPETVQMAEDAIRCAYTWRGDARGRPLRPDDFDAKYQQPEAGLSP
ncbi:MAG: HEAT repeat domain-containing protein, partial [Verrucomicrobiota bacterium]